MKKWIAPRLYSLSAIVVVFLLLAGGGIVYTKYVQRQTLDRTEEIQRQSDQRWCPILIIADRPNPNRPPQTPDELEARRALHKLRLDLRCGGG